MVPDEAVVALSYVPPYGDLVPLNTERTILDAVGADVLREVLSEYLDLLDTSMVVYERTGDYAFRSLSSDWCRRLDAASRARCRTGDNRAALAGGGWLCHESCWTQASRTVIETDRPIDIECAGGLRLHAVPIRAGDDVVGCITVGHGSPPIDPAAVAALAGRFEVDAAELQGLAESCRAQPAAVVERMSRRLASAARLIGEMVRRHRAETRLRASERRLRTLVEGLPQLVWTCRADGPCDYLSARWVEYTGIPEADQLGYRWLEQLHPDDRERVIAEWGAIAPRGGDFDIEFRIRRADGEHRWFKTRAIPLRDGSGQVVKWFGSNMDIDDNKRAEEEIRRLNADLERRVQERTAELQQSNEELGAFSYSVSHDLRAPLRAIDGFTRILLDDYHPQLDAEGQRICAVIRDNTDKMSRLIDDLLAFSRLGRVEMQPAPIDMAALVRAVFDELTTPAGRGRIELTVGALPAAVGDRTLIRQVWMNLLDNAVKFSGKRERAVIAVTGERQAGETVYTVRDNGAGFEMAYVHKLFGVFQRLHTAREFDGTGVGLALVQRIVRRHGGRVWGEGEPERGATFGFALPAPRPSHE